MKAFLFILLLGFILPLEILAQTITGTVRSANDQQVLIDAGIALTRSKRSTKTNAFGQFSIQSVGLPDTLIITHAGYQSQRIPINKLNRPLNIVLKENQTNLKEVIINTGYYKVAKERATGSFTQINNEQINRSTGTNILERLEGITNGLQFDRRNFTAENGSNQQPELRIRGLSTIEGGSAPLIIVDNFPYNGDISSINPNDVESVTILKDAAAASIWGARAGNGVIVINTKLGHFNKQMQVSFNSITNLTSKPDLGYTRNYLPSPVVMEIQESLFKQGAYPENDLTYIPAYAELLIKLRDGKILQSDFESERLIMQQTDFREQARRYLYQAGISQQYALNISGGSNLYKYYLSGNYDKGKENIIGNSNNRINLNFQNTFKIGPTLEVTGNIWYTRQHNKSNGITYSSIGSGVREPYTRLANAEGQPLATGYYGKRLAFLEEAQANGLLDWQYRPLKERDLIDKINERDEVRVNTGIKYNFMNYFNINATYQYLRGTNEDQTYYDAESYYTSDLVNRFTQADGTLIIPNGGILDGATPGKYEGHSGRIQFNYNQHFAQRHQLNALAGTEISQHTVDRLPGFRIYDYSKELLGGTNRFDYTRYYPLRPLGNGPIEGPQSVASRTNNRNLSHFGNLAYNYDQRYTVSASARWDGSNLLGVKTNQRGTLLWSTGISWQLDKEIFYPFKDWLSYFRLRATYGSGGLVDKSQSQYPTIAFFTDDRTGFRYANLQHPGNPSLRWEQVNTLNLGVDFAIKDQRISGSIEWYNKKANHLLGSFMIDPTTGAGANYKQNYANMQTKGLDVQLKSININSEFKWESDFLFNFTRNKTTDYTTPETTVIWDYFYGSSKPPVKGRSIDAFYTFPWNGLSSDTGLPLIYIDGAPTTDYTAYVSNFKPENLIVGGVEVPPFYGSLRNTFSYKGFQLSALLSFKSGYVFRRTSMEPGSEYLPGNSNFHVDYFKRWKQPGDEALTTVPATVLSYNADLASYYRLSEILKTSGDHIRLQDINLSYSLFSKAAAKSLFQQVRIFAYVRNIGIIWRKNKFGIDPDYPNTEFPAPRTLAFGLQITL